MPPDLKRHGKTWQSVPAGQVACGDIVPGVGLVVDVRVVKGSYTGPVVVLTGPADHRMVANPAAAVRVFRLAAADPDVGPGGAS